MKKRTQLRRFTIAAIIISLLIHACSMNTPDNSIIVESTSTPTAASNPSDNNTTAIPTPTEEPNPSAPAPVQNFDVCSFFTAAEAEPIVGTAMIEVTRGSDVDEVTGGPLDYCNYIGDDVALVVSLVKSNAVKDSPEWQGQLLEMTNTSEPDATTEPFPGLGEQAYWAVTEHSAGWFVAKFPYVFALVVGGNIGYSEDYKEDLNTLAQVIVNSLP